MKTIEDISLRRICLAVLMLVSYADTVVLGAPQGAKVISGSASFQQTGNTTTITAGDRSIINYTGFNLAPNEIVRFVQPNVNATVLNRVVSPNPTNIFGQIQSNGIVYIVNPYGVYFRNGAVLNVGDLYAAAGEIANQDFTSGQIHFTNLAGDVVNDGVLAADNRIALLGANVVNTGTLTSAHGAAALVSAQDVYVGTRNSNIFVQANGAARTSAAATGSITNRGTVSAPRVLLGAGDLYSTAIVNTGLLQGRQITVNAGRHGSATVGGRLDASAKGKTGTGSGGNIQVLGGEVALKGAILDASGVGGGGSVQVGGDFHGAGTLAPSSNTTVDAKSVIEANATGRTGSGGTVVVWSQDATTDLGTISARGGAVGGNGGSVEVSSHGLLGFYGLVDTRAPVGQIGSLLLDPKNIEITAGGTVGKLPDGPADTPGAPATFTVSQASLEASTTSIYLSASDDIRVEPLQGGTLTLQANATLTAGVNTSTGAVSSGSFVMVDTKNTIIDPGHFVTIKANGVSNHGGINDGNAYAIDLGSVDTSSKSGPGGEVTVKVIGAASNAPVLVGGKIVTSSATAAAGTITIHGTSLKVDGALTSTGVTGGDVTLRSRGALEAVGAIDSSATGAGSAGAIKLLTTAASTAIATPVTAANLIATSASGQGGTITIGPALGGLAPTAITLDGVVTTTSPTTSTGVFDISVVTTGKIDFNSGSTPIDLGGNTLLKGRELSSSTLDLAGRNLTLELTDAVTVDGSVGKNTGRFDNVRNFVSAGPVDLDGAFTTEGGQTYDAPVQLVGTAGTVRTLDATGAIAFEHAAATIDGPLSLAIGGAGHTTAVRFDGTIGQSAPLDSLTVRTTGGTIFAMAIPTAPADGVRLSGALSISGPTVFDLPGDSATVGAGVYSVTSNGAETFAGPVTLSRDTTLRGGGAGIDFSSTVNGPGALLLITPAVDKFSGAVGGISPLARLTTSGGATDIDGRSVATVDTQTYGGPVLLGASGASPLTTIAAGGEVTFDSTVGSAGGVSPQGLTVSTPALITFAAQVGGAPGLAGVSVVSAPALASLSTRGGGDVDIHSGVTTVTTVGGDQIYGGRVELTGDATLEGHSLSLSPTGLSGNAGKFSLTLNFAGPVQVSALFTSLDNLLSEGSGGTEISGAITTHGFETYTDAVTLTADATLATGHNAPITFGSTLQGSHNLTVKPGGTGAAIFGGDVGGTTAATRLASLTVDGPADLTGGGVVATSGGQDYANTLKLFVPAALVSTAGAIQVAARTPGAAALVGNGHDLTVNAVSTSFGQIVTGGNLDFTVAPAGRAKFDATVAAASLKVTGLAELVGDVTTASPTIGQSYSSVQLDRSLTLTDTAAGPIDFGGAVNGIGTLETLTLDTAGGAVQFNGLVGNISAPAALTINSGTVAFRMNLSGQASNVGGVRVGAGGVDINAAATFAAIDSGLSATDHPTVTTTGSQTYQDAVTLAQNTSLASTGIHSPNEVTFKSTVDGNFGLIVATTGDIIFDGLVGDAAPLAGLMTGNVHAKTGETEFNMHVSNAVAGVVVAGALRVNNPVIFDASNSSAADPSVLTVGKTGEQTYEGAARLDASTFLVGAARLPAAGTQLTGGGPIDFLSGAGIKGASGKNLKIETGPGVSNFQSSIRAGSVDLGGGVVTVKGPIELTGSLSETPHPGATANQVQLGGGAVTTSSAQEYDAPIKLNADTSFTSTGGDSIAFESSLDGSDTATLSTAGPVSFVGAVGGGIPLKSVNVTNGAGTTNFLGSEVITTGLQKYDGAVLISNAAAALTSINGAINFEKTIDANSKGPDGLDLTATTGGVLFGANVGGATPLAELTVDGALTVSGQTITATDDIALDDAVTGTGSLTITGNRVGVGGNIMAAGSLDLESSNSSSPLLLLGGTQYVSSMGSVTLNEKTAYKPVDTTVVNQTGISTIIFTAPNATVDINAHTDFVTGLNQKIIAFGSLDLTAATGKVTIGDLAALDNVTVTAREVDLLTHGPRYNFAARTDETGVDIIAGGTIDFGAAKIEFPGTLDRTANFITMTGSPTIQRAPGVSLFKEPGVVTQFKEPEVVTQFPKMPPTLGGLPSVSIPQPGRGGQESLDVVAALAGALPDQKPIDVRSDLTVSASQMEELKKLGIHPRVAQGIEHASAASKRALFAQLVDGADMENYGRLQPMGGGVSRLEPSDFVVVVDRMGEREIQSILKTFEGLYGKNKEKAPEIGAAFQKAFDDYSSAEQTGDPARFGPYLQANPGKYPAVDTAVKSFDGLFGQIENLGLTDKEIAKSEEHITSDLGVTGPSAADMVNVINSLRPKPVAKRGAAAGAPAPAPPAAGAKPGLTTPVPGVAAPSSTPPPPAPAPDMGIPEIPALPEASPTGSTPAPTGSTAPPAPKSTPGATIPEISAVPESSPTAAAPTPPPAASPAPNSSSAASPPLKQ